MELSYLQQDLNDDPARYVIEVFSGLGSYFHEAIKTLRKGHDRLHPLQPAHVQAIMEAPVLKDGISKELRYFIDILHLAPLSTQNQGL